MSDLQHAQLRGEQDLNVYFNVWDMKLIFFSEGKFTLVPTYFNENWNFYLLQTRKSNMAASCERSTNTHLQYFDISCALFSCPILLAHRQLIMA